MKRKTLVALAATAGLILPMTGVTSAFAADAELACTPVKGAVTGQYVSDMITACGGKIDFGGPTEVTGSTVVAYAQGVTFNNPEGNQVTFKKAEPTKALLLINDGDFTFNNDGSVSFEESDTYGLSLQSNAGVTPTVTLAGSGGKYAFSGLKKFSIESQNGSGGSFVFKNAEFDINVPAGNVETAMAFNKNVTSVTFDNAKVNIDSNADAEGWGAVVYSEAEMNIINGTQFKSLSKNFYNLSVVDANLTIQGNQDPGCAVTPSTMVELVTKKGANVRIDLAKIKEKLREGGLNGADLDAAAAAAYATFRHPVVGLNAANNEVTISKGANVTLRDETGDIDAEKSALELQDAELFVTKGGQVKSSSLGIDQKQTGKSYIKISGKSSIFEVEALPKNLSKEELENKLAIIYPAEGDADASHVKIDDVEIASACKTPELPGVQIDPVVLSCEAKDAVKLDEKQQEKVIEDIKKSLEGSGWELADKPVGLDAELPAGKSPIELEIKAEYKNDKGEQEDVKLFVFVRRPSAEECGGSNNNGGAVTPTDPEKPDTDKPEKPETEAPAKPAEKDQPAKQKPAMKQTVAKKPALAATGSSALALGLASFGLVLLGGVMMATRRRSTTA